jgi:hypothetical protein
MSFSLSERRQKWQSFMDSQEFGKHTWNTLHLLNSNSYLIKKTIRIYLKLIEGSHIESISDNIEGIHLLRIKQHIVLDCIAKLQSVIETTLVLIHALSDAYGTIAEFMSFYDLRLPKQIVEKIRKNDYNMRKVLGLIDIGELGLSNDQRKLLGKIYSDTIEYMIKEITNLANFYDKYRIVYGKWRHGQTFQSGDTLTTTDIIPHHPSNLKDSLLLVVDRKQESDMPKGYVVGRSSDPSLSKWFNVQSIIKFDNNLINEIENIMLDLENVIAYITKNHITYAMNCGKEYLPFHEIRNDEYSLWFYFDVSSLSEQDNLIIQSITNKISEVMNIDKTTLNMLKLLNDDKIAESVTNNWITNIWFKS